MKKFGKQWLKNKSGNRTDSKKEVRNSDMKEDTVWACKGTGKGCRFRA